MSFFYPSFCEKFGLEHPREPLQKIKKTIKAKTDKKPVHYHQPKLTVSPAMTSTTITVAMQRATINLGSILRALSSSESKYLIRPAAE
jgi:hypothetical protein